METNGQPHLSSGMGAVTSLTRRLPGTALPPRFSGATSQHQAVLWVCGGNVALIPAVDLSLIIHRLRKASLLTAAQGDRKLGSLPGVGIPSFVLIAVESERCLGSAG